MPYVSVPKDLTKVKTKVALNLTKRQLACFGAAVAIGLPAYIGARGALGNELSAILMIAVMLPLFMLAMFEKDGQPAEKIARNFARAKLLWPGVRPYKTENLYAYLEGEGKNGESESEGAAIRSGKASERPSKTR
jgi:hypothetical protein